MFWKSSFGVAVLVVSIPLQLGFAFWYFDWQETDKNLLVVLLLIFMAFLFYALVRNLRARDKLALKFWGQVLSPHPNRWLWYCAIFGPTSILSLFSVNSLLSFGSVNCILSINSINCIGCVNSVSNVFSQEDRLPFDYGSP